MSDKFQYAREMVKNNTILSQSIINGYYKGVEDAKTGSEVIAMLKEVLESSLMTINEMEKDENGLWVLEYKADQGFHTYYRVVITEETVVDAVPEVHIIEGDFTEL